jgi:peptidoglycan/LPS O-acetylase OafA/YrhL
MGNDAGAGRPATNPLGYRPALDGVRGIAILAVVSLHAFGRPAEGALGVDLFFVLSGFLITSLLLERRQRGDTSLRRFYARRALRLLPALFAMLTAYVAWTAVTDPRKLGHAITGTALAVGYVANIAAAWHPETIPHELSQIWSLSQEEQFYLVWPPLLLLLMRVRPSVVPRALALLIGAVALERFLIVILTVGGGGEFPLSRLYLGPDTHAEPILIGCLFGVCFVTGQLPAWLAAPGPRRRAAGVSAAFVLCGILFFDHIWPFLFATPLLTVYAAAAGIVILSAATDTDGIARLLAFRPLVFVGRISYSLYLWHLLVLTAIGVSVPEIGVRSIVGVAASVVIAAASFFLVEQRFLRLKPRAASTSSGAARAYVPLTP